MESSFAEQMQELLSYATTHKVAWLYFFFFVSALIENLFPPYPGDSIIFGGALLAGMGKLELWGVILFPCLGSLSGAMILYWAGKKGARKLFFLNGIFFNPEQLSKIEGWFKKYGEKVLILSRFMTGVRSAVALSAGVGNVHIRKMVIYTGISILIWNGALISIGTILKANSEDAYSFLVTYNKIILTIFALAVLYWIFKLLKKKFKKEPI